MYPLSFENYLNPLEQFQIKDLIGISIAFIENFKLSFTNMNLYLIISAISIYNVLYFSSNFNKITCESFSTTVESIYDTVQSIIITQINKIKGQKFFPLVYCLFLFILINNILGMIPYSFAPTSHFILTFAFSFAIVLGSTVLGLIKHGLKFFSLFVPAGCPLGLLPLLVLIEFISYLARNVSLGLRLAANILSGHMLLNILSGFTFKIMTMSFFYAILSILPLGFVIAFSGLELGIAFIQSQVFIVLSCSYIKDALYLH